MCGIHGEYFLNSKLSGKLEFCERNDRNYSRGPDETGYWTDNKNVQLGFRRLSILDLKETGSQPMTSNNGLYTIVFNGEIYNHIELKERLEEYKYTFNGTSDTEVLVNYFECFGLDKTLKDIDGMFAIALVNNSNNGISLIRDFAGIKPLFYSWNNKDLVFGSGYEQISKHPLNKSANINQSVLKLYLELQYIPAPYGILEGTSQVNPGEIINFSNEGNVTKSFYFDLDSSPKNDSKKQDLETILNKSVRETVLSTDVPLGTFLSGGIDSPLISYFASLFNPNIHALSLGSDSPVHDESKEALKYSNLIDIETTLIEMDSQKANDIFDDAVNSLQEPFADMSLIPTYQITNEASKKFKVMLSGDGGDELFYGYERFNSVGKNLRWLFIPKTLRYLFYGIDKVLTKNKNMNSCILMDNLSEAHKGLHSRISEENILALFPNLKEVDVPKLWFYSYSEKQDKKSFYRSIQKAEFYGMMQKTLAKVDRMSMANSLEVRVPFLRKKIIEYSRNLDPSLNSFGSSKKTLLKNLLQSKLPEAPIDEVKKGFSVPLGKWIREDLKEKFQEVLFDQKFLRKFEISRKNLDKIWTEHLERKKDHKSLLFTLYVLNKWSKSLEE